MGEGITHKEREYLEDGRQASMMWESHYKAYYEQSRDNLLRAFERLKADERDAMVLINMQLRALNQLKMDLDTRIAKGRAVTRQIDDREVMN